MKRIKDGVKKLRTISGQVMGRERTNQNMAYRTHFPKLGCIIKSKAYKRYEFRVKVRGSLEFPCNPHYGHSATTPLSQTDRTTGKKPEEVFVDRSYRGHDVFDSQVFICGQKHGVNTMLSYAGHNTRIILKKDQDFCADFWRRLFSCIGLDKSMSFLAFW